MLHVEFLQCRQHIRILYSYIVYTLMDLTPAGLNKIQNSETVVEKGSFWKTLLSWTLKDTLTSPKKRENKQFKKKKTCCEQKMSICLVVFPIKVEQISLKSCKPLYTLKTVLINIISDQALNDYV